jgi:hypothetical protein
MFPRRTVRLDNAYCLAFSRLLTCATVGMLQTIVSGNA